MSKPYRIDDRLVTARELIKAAQDEGFVSPDGLFLTSESASFLREKGHDVGVNHAHTG